MSGSPIVPVIDFLSQGVREAGELISSVDDQIEREDTTQSAAILNQWGSWDLERPLATLLREGTVVAHEAVQRPAIVNMLIRGEIPKELHIQYLTTLYHIYATLEAGLEQHSSNPTLSGAHNPSLLFRERALDQDLAFLTGRSDWKSLPETGIVRDRVNAELTAYLDRLRLLADSSRDASSPLTSYVYPPPPPKPQLLLAHMYVRFMGDLSGGQMIKAAVSKAYGLTDDGLRFYDFDMLNGSPGVAGPSQLKLIRHWLRSAIDRSGESLSLVEKAEMMQEANHAFELNVRLFSSFGTGETMMPKADRRSHKRASAYSVIKPQSVAGKMGEAKRTAAMLSTVLLVFLAWWALRLSS